MKFRPPATAMRIALALTLAAQLLAAPVFAADVVELTVKEIEIGLANHTLTATDLVSSFLARINKYEPIYNAYVSMNPNALADAAALDAEYALTGPRSPLHGVPIIIKDSMNVKGLPTTGGYGGFVSPADGGTGMYLTPTTDSPIVARLRAAGAIILGKGNMPIFARSGSNANNSFYGPTFNPYNLGVLPGGSSTGSAVATSASMAVLGMAEETGGSIQNPAGANGLVGIKTTFGLVPTSGGIPLSGSTRDVFGPVAKSVYDAAVSLDAIAGFDSSDFKTIASVGNIPAAGYAAGLSTTALQGKRIGLWGPGWKNATLTPETQALYDASVSILQAQGATVIANPFQGTDFIAKTTFPASGNSLPYDINQFFASLGPGMPKTYAEFQTLTGIDLFQANGPLVGNINATLTAALANPAVLPDISGHMDGRAALLGTFRTVMDSLDLDALFYPQMWDKLGARVGGAFRNTSVSEINALGTPGVNVSGGFYADGTPFSVQFLGDQWSEGTLLAMAYDFEAATNFRVAPVLVPEPGSLVMLGVCTVAIVWRRRAALPPSFTVAA